MYENSYYENWLEGLETLLLEKGLVDAEELVLAANISIANRGNDFRHRNQTSRRRRYSLPARLALWRPIASRCICIGDSVLVKASETAGHTRAPKYAQGVRPALVAAQLGCHSFPDSNAQGVHEGKHSFIESPSVACDLWGSHSATQHRSA